MRALTLQEIHCVNGADATTALGYGGGIGGTIIGALSGAAIAIPACGIAVAIVKVGLEWNWVSTLMLSGVIAGGSILTGAALGALIGASVGAAGGYVTDKVIDQVG